MDGFIGMRLAARRPQLLKSLVLIDSSPDREADHSLSRYKRIHKIYRWLGPRWVIPSTMEILFGQKILTDPARANQREDIKRQLASLNRVGVSLAVLGVITRRGIYEELGNIQHSTLVMVGDEGMATMPEKSKRITSKVANSQLVISPVRDIQLQSKNLIR